MNYDHRFHAGNFADVFKHAVLTRILLYLQRKPTPFRVIDTHAGSGVYDLDAGEAGRTQEWRAGIGRIDPAVLSDGARELLQPYLDAVGAAAQGSAPYPGSPALALRLARPVDRSLFYELHPDAGARLKACVGPDKRAKVVALDGYIGLTAAIPPVERRGLVLIDPPFETPDEFHRLANAITAAHAKWREGIVMAWFPVKDRRDVGRLGASLAGADIDDVLWLELAVGPVESERRLAACGLLVVNPPYTLEAEMACLLPELQRQLGAGSGAWRIERRAATQGGRAQR